MPLREFIGSEIHFSSFIKNLLKMKTIILIVASIFLCKVASDDGPCPDFATMENYDNLKELSAWKTYSVYESNNNDVKCRCVSSTMTKLPNSNISFIQVNGYLANTPNVSFEINATCIPIEGKPGTFNLEYEEKTAADLGSFIKSAEKKFFVLDTDYESYAIGIGCFGDGKTTHTLEGAVDYKDTKPPASLLEKATLLFKKAGLDVSTIKASDQTNCPNRET